MAPATRFDQWKQANLWAYINANIVATTFRSFSFCFFSLSNLLFDRLISDVLMGWAGCNLTTGSADRRR